MSGTVSAHIGVKITMPIQIYGFQPWAWRAHVLFRKPFQPYAHTHHCLIIEYFFSFTLLNQYGCFQNHMFYVTQFMHKRFSEQTRKLNGFIRTKAGKQCVLNYTQLNKPDFLYEVIGSLWLWFIMVKSRPQRAYGNHIDRTGRWVTYRNVDRCVHAAYACT